MPPNTPHQKRITRSAALLSACVFALVCLLACEPVQSFADESAPTLSKKYPGPTDGLVQNVPAIPRTGGWSGDNQLGRLAKYGPDQRATQSILKLDEWGPPEIWTVSLFVKEDFRLFNGFDIKARLNFGAGGSTQPYICDWVNGAQISWPMNAVNVEAIFANVDVATEGAGLSIGAQLARGSRGGTAAPRLTIAENLIVVHGTNSETFDIPAFATRILFIPSDINSLGNFFAATTKIVLVSGDDSGAFDVAVGVGSHPDGGVIAVPVSGSARKVLVVNEAAGNIAGSLIAELEG